MTTPRSRQVSLAHTPYYHCTSQCVRQSYLCGYDFQTRRNYEHRKEWIENRLEYLASVFAIDLLAYAVMSNHYHVTIRVNPTAVLHWSDRSVIRRWSKIFSVPNNITKPNVECWRNRLCDLSWFMRCVNEPIARRANREDECTGRFWAGRFHCQALLTESALVRCMVYVDLNPIRSGSATTPESSMHTSIRARLTGRISHLAEFRGSGRQTDYQIPIAYHEYVSLLDWTGRQLREGKRGRISPTLPPILHRIDAGATRWVKEIEEFGTSYFRAIGSTTSIDKYRNHVGRNWLKGRHTDLFNAIA